VADLATHMQAARAVLDELGLREQPDKRPRPVSATQTSLPIACQGPNDRYYLLKYFVPPQDDRIYPAGVRPEDYARREVAFYRLLDDTDPDRRDFPAPRTVLVGPGDPPAWLLLEWIPGAVGPAEEVLGMDHVFELLQQLQSIPHERLLGRRSFPLKHWDPVGYLEQVRLMYDAVLFVVGERRWRAVQNFFAEAVRWMDNRKRVLVHGDFTDQNILVSEDGKPFLIDFERVGVGNVDHDIAWFWIHSNRNQDWKKQLVMRWFGGRVGGDRIRAEWGIRATIVYLALRRLRWGYLSYGDEDARKSANLALLDAALAGGSDLFPF
jgi:aminoglycoside phosphotransferase (APT) family kinase protein